MLAFLSVLELVRTTEIRLFQTETFGDIIARCDLGYITEWQATKRALNQEPNQTSTRRAQRRGEPGACGNGRRGRSRRLRLKTRAAETARLCCQQSDAERAAIIETLIFVSDEPLSSKIISDVLKEDKT